MVNSPKIQIGHLSEILDSAMDAIISIDSNFRIIIFNHAAVQLFGFPANQMLGQPLEKILPEDIRQKHDEILRKFISTPSSQVKKITLGKIRGLRSNGEIFPIEAAISKTESKDTIILTAILRDVSERNRNEEKVNSLLQEKEFILKEIHHRVKNNLFTVFSLLQMQTAEVQSEEAKEILLDAAGRIRSMMTLYDKLYQKENDLNSINLREYIPVLANDIIKIFPSPTPVQIQTNLEDVNLEIKKVSPLGIILNELITNSMKYAFTKDKPRLIKIQGTIQDDVVRIVYEDNGVGIKNTEMSSENHSGFGLQMVKILVSQLNGKLNIETDNGSRFTIDFKI